MLPMENSQMTRATRPVGDLLHSGDNWLPPLKSAGSEEKPARQISGGALAASSLEADRNTPRLQISAKPLTNLEHTFF